MIEFKATSNLLDPEQMVCALMTRVFEELQREQKTQLLVAFELPSGAVARFQMTLLGSAPRDPEAPR